VSARNCGEGTGELVNESQVSVSYTEKSSGDRCTTMEMDLTLNSALKNG
jgi:hypothetical protein